MTKNIKISLILPTINRYDEPKKFMSYLKKQVYRDFELIIVDQNSDNRIYGIVKEIKPNYVYKILRSEKGLSKARNVGLKNICGEIVAFPDDDCWYSENLLAGINKFFSRNINKYEGLVVSCKDGEGNPSFGRYDNRDRMLNKYEMLRKLLSVNTFLRRTMIKSRGEFNELLGLGAESIFLGGEDMEYALTAISKGHKFYYKHSLVVFHPQPYAYYNKEEIEKRWGSWVEEGRIYRTYFSFSFFVYKLFRNLFVLILFLLLFRHKKARMRVYILLAMLKGYISRQKM